MVTTFGLCELLSEPGASAAERISRHRKSHLAGEAAITTAAFKSRALNSGRDRKTPRPQGATGGCASRSPIRFWPGIDGSLPRSSTAPNTDSIPAVLQFQRKLKPWWSGWRERTPAGDMTESLAHWPTWAITCPIKRWGTYSVAMVSLPLRREAKSRRGKTFSPLT